MSHPDPLHDYEDMEQESRLFPWIDDNYDDYNDFNEMVEDGADDFWYDEADESMDGDHDSAMRDAGFGTDEDYGYFGEDF